MRLEIDVGNTRVKWRLCEHNSVRCRGVGFTHLLKYDILFAKLLSGSMVGQVTQVLIGSVVPEITVLLSRWCVDVLKCDVSVAIVKEECAGVINGYEDINQMGVDRWLAILAAKHRSHGAILIVDAGSAVTIEGVLADGRHSGGYIVPGLQMMNQALLANTEKVRGVGEDYPLVFSFGRSTEAAVLSGLPLMLWGVVSHALKEIGAVTDSSVGVVVTGGDGEYVTNLLRQRGVVSVEWVPDLVMDGLSLAI